MKRKFIVEVDVIELEGEVNLSESIAEAIEAKLNELEGQVKIYGFGSLKVWVKRSENR